MNFFFRERAGGEIAAKRARTNGLPRAMRKGAFPQVCKPEYDAPSQKSSAWIRALRVGAISAKQGGTAGITCPGKDDFSLSGHFYFPQGKKATAP